jgi:hypothetical protein
MKIREIFSSIPRFLRTVVLMDLSIFVIVGLVGWFGGWRTAYQYGEGLVIAGALAIGLGFLSIVGNWCTIQSVGYQYGQSVGAQSLGERTGQTVKDIAQNYRFLIQMIVVSVAPIAIGVLIQISTGGERWPITAP